MPDRLNAAVRRVPSLWIYLVLALPAPLFLYMGMVGALGADPIKELEHRLGKFALQLLIAGLCVTPLRRYTGINLIKYRRAIGIMAFVYVTLHLLVWLVLDVQAMGQIWNDILKRPYITIGMTGFVLLVPLAATSNTASIRKLGPVWRRLHRLVYAAVLLGGAHYVMLSKGFILEPYLYGGAILALLLLRVPVGLSGIGRTQR